MLPAGAVTAESAFVGNGVVVDLGRLLDEVHILEQSRPDVRDSLWISRSAHLVQEEHRRRDRSPNSQAIGTTGQGVGPAYSDRAARTGIRIQDILTAPGPDGLSSADQDLAARF